MSYAYAVKVFCDIIFYFAVVSTLTVSLGQTPQVIATPTVLAVCAYFGHLLSKKEPRWLRMLPLAGIPLILLFTRARTDLIMSVPPVVYVCWYLWKRPYAPEHGDALSRFYLCMKLLPFVLVFGALVGNWDAMRDVVVPYLFYFLLLTVLLLRTLRHDAATISQTRFKLVNLGSMAGVALVGWMLSSGLMMRIFRFIGSCLVRFILRPLMMGAVYLFAGIVWLLSKAFEGMEFDPESLDLSQLQENLENTDMSSMISGEGAAATESPVWDYIFIGLAVLAAAAILFVFFRAMARHNSHEDDNHFEAVRESLEESDHPVRRNARDNRGRVRHYYRKFLKLAVQRGFDLTEFMDSSQIERGTWPLFRSRASEPLRDVYVRARYSSAEVTEEDVRQAKECYGKLKRDED